MVKWVKEKCDQICKKILPFLHFTDKSGEYVNIWCFSTLCLSRELCTCIIVSSILCKRFPVKFNRLTILIWWDYYYLYDVMFNGCSPGTIQKFLSNLSYYKLHCHVQISKYTHYVPCAHCLSHVVILLGMKEGGREGGKVCT